MKIFCKCKHKCTSFLHGLFCKIKVFKSANLNADTNRSGKGCYVATNTLVGF